MRRSVIHYHGHGPTHALRHLPRMLPGMARSRTAHDPTVADSLIGLLAGGGFDDAREVEHIDHRVGRVTFVRATRP